MGGGRDEGLGKRDGGLGVEGRKQWLNKSQHTDAVEVLKKAPLPTTLAWSPARRPLAFNEQTCVYNLVAEDVLTGMRAKLPFDLK